MCKIISTTLFNLWNFSILDFTGHAIFNQPITLGSIYRISAIQSAICGCNRVLVRLASAQIAGIELTVRWFVRGKREGGRGGYCKGNRPDFSHPPLNCPRRYYRPPEKNDPSFPPDSTLASAGDLESVQGFIIVFSLRKSSSWHLRFFECLAYLVLVSTNSIYLTF